ncbi:MAG: EAL domain-containing protein, partial [Spirochaetaceae bacterium]|nr:EAL domain-containing protein [Spirochaetaceae bacterium]
MDKRFISGISRNSSDEALINSIISIAGNLKMEIVAEGVEMPNQPADLNEKGCRYFQGFLFSKPVPIEENIEHYSGVSGTGFYLTMDRFGPPRTSPRVYVMIPGSSSWTLILIRYPPSSDSALMRILS